MLTPRDIAQGKPEWWFRPLSDAAYHLASEPDKIEYLNVWTGETFVHVGGTACWDQRSNVLKVDGLMRLGVTHYRLLSEFWPVIDRGGMR